MPNPDPRRNTNSNVVRYIIPNDEKKAGKINAPQGFRDGVLAHLEEERDLQSTDVVDKFQTGKINGPQGLRDGVLAHLEEERDLRSTDVGVKVQDCSRRLLIVHGTHLKILAELTTIPRNEAFHRGAGQVLQEGQGRLVYRASAYIRTDNPGYTPGPGDLADREKLEMMEAIAEQPAVQEGHRPFSTERGVQYVALGNTNPIIQKCPDILKHEMKGSFAKHNHGLAGKEQQRQDKATREGEAGGIQGDIKTGQGTDGGRGKDEWDRGGTIKKTKMPDEERLGRKTPRKKALTRKTLLKRTRLETEKIKVPDEEKPMTKKAPMKRTRRKKPLMTKTLMKKALRKKLKRKARRKRLMKKAQRKKPMKKAQRKKMMKKSLRETLMQKALR